MATTRGTDGDVQARVAEALGNTPGDTAQVGVSVRDGMVTLSGAVDSVADRLALKRAVMGAAGVRGVADRMVVRQRGSPGDTDGELAAMANQMLQSAAELPAGAVIAGVRGRVVTLTGTVTVPSQRDAAARAVRHINGVVGISNDVQVAGQVAYNRPWVGPAGPAAGAAS